MAGLISAVTFGNCASNSAAPSRVAGACGFTKSLLSKIESNKVVPPVATLVKSQPHGHQGVGADRSRHSVAVVPQGPGGRRQHGQDRARLLDLPFRDTLPGKRMQLSCSSRAKAR